MEDEAWPDSLLAAETITGESSGELFTTAESTDTQNPVGVSASFSITWGAALALLVLVGAGLAIHSLLEG